MNIQKRYNIPTKTLVFIALTINFIVAIFIVHLVSLEPGVTEITINGVTTPATEKNIHTVRLVLTVAFAILGSLFAYLSCITLRRSRLQRTSRLTPPSIKEKSKK